MLGLNHPDDMETYKDGRDDMEQWTGSKLDTEYIKGVYCHSTYLTYMQSTSCDIPGWINLKLESRLLAEISITSDTQMTAS